MTTRNAKLQFAVGRAGRVLLWHCVRISDSSKRFHSNVTRVSIQNGNRGEVGRLATVAMLLIVTLLIGNSVSAQTPTSHENASQQLRDVENLAMDARKFFGKASTAELSQRLAEVQYENLRRALTAFLQLAPKNDVDDYLASYSENADAAAVMEQLNMFWRRVDVKELEFFAERVVNAIDDTRAQLVASATLSPLRDNAQFYAEITPPAANIEFLRGIKWALDRSALLRDDFYSLQNLTRFFGFAGRVKRYPDHLSASWFVEPFTAKRVQAASPCRIRLERSKTVDEKGIRASLTWFCGRPTILPVTFQEVNSVFHSDVKPHFYNIADGNSSNELPFSLPPPIDANVVRYSYEAARVGAGGRIRRRLLLLGPVQAPHSVDAIVEQKD